MAKRGRPKGSKNKSGIDKEVLRAVIRAKVAEHMGPMLDAQIANAKGIKYLVARERKGGKFVRLDEQRVKAILGGKDSEHEMIEVWEKDPSVQAFTDLMNRTVDKPAETMNATVDLSITQNIEARLKAARERLAKRKHGNGHSKP